MYADRDAVHHLSIGRFAGPLREFYLVDERETDDPQRNVTEITWPGQPRATPSD